MRSTLRGERKQRAVLADGAHLCCVAAAIVGGAVVGSAVFGPDAPDPTPGIEASAASSERVGMEQVALGREQLAYARERNAKTDALAERVANAQINSMTKQDALADEYANYNRTTFRPLEQSMVENAQNYDTPEMQEAMAGRAGASIKDAFAGQRASTARDMARMGINPNSGRAADLQSKLDVQEALGVAGAENKARDDVKTQAWARKMDAASLGRNLPSAQATAAQIGITAGNSAVANTVAANTSANQGIQTGAQILSNANTSFGTSNVGYARTAADIANVYGLQKAQWDNQMGAVAKVGGMFL